MGLAGAAGAGAITGAGAGAITGAGAIAGVGELGHTKALPFTVLAQYRFMEPTAKFRPYVGAGITYAYNFSERTTNTLSALKSVESNVRGARPRRAPPR